MNLCEPRLCFINFSSFLNGNLLYYWWFIVSFLQKIHFVPKDRCRSLQIHLLLLMWARVFCLSLTQMVLVLKRINMQDLFLPPTFREKENYRGLYIYLCDAVDNQNLKLQGQMYFPEWLNYFSVWWQQRNRDAWALRLPGFHFITGAY